MGDSGDGHSHAHAAGACHGGHDHGYHRADGDAHAVVEEVPLEGDRQGAEERRRHTAASSAAANLSEAEANQRKLKRATAFVLVFFVVEIIGGVWSGSLAIISDAAHLLADVSGFILAMVANEIASRPACDKLTYGPVRAEVLSALFSTVTILAISLFLVVEAIARIIAFWKGEGEEIDGKMMSFIALLGLLVNLALLGIFGHEHGGHDHSHGHGHGHGHGHAHDDHDDHDHTDHDHHDHDPHDEEHGLVAAASSGKTGTGVDERSSLVDSIGGGSVGAPTNPEPNGLDISGSSNASSVGEVAARNGGKGGGSIQYGSLGVGDGKGEKEALVATGVAGFPHMPVTGAGDVVAGKAEAKVVKIKKEKTKNINMEAAVLHAVTDLVQSAGVLLAGLLIWYDPRWKWADPIATLFFVGLVVNSTRWLLQRAFNVLLEGVPDSIDYDRLRSRLSEIEGVTDLHCLHVWSLTLGRTVVSAHIKATDPEKALTSAHEICEDMGIAHSTIQVQVDHCLPASCTHPCVSAVGSCCGPEGIGGSPLSASKRSISPSSVYAP